MVGGGDIMFWDWICAMHWKGGGAFAFEVCGSQLRVGFFRSCQIAILGLRTTLPCVLLRHASC